MNRLTRLASLALAAFLLVPAAPAGAERRDKWFRIRVPGYNTFYRLYNPTYRIGALANYWNLNVYDVLMTQPDTQHVEGPYYTRLRELALGGRIRLDPDVETASPRFARLAWGVGESFMWAHHLHENAFDAYAAPDMTMEERHRIVERATDDYFRNPRALAGVELPMETIRALPYHGAFARRYPRVNGLVWAGHWVHAGVYEGQLDVLRGEKSRSEVIAEVDAEFVRLIHEPADEHPHFSHIAEEFTALHPRASAIFSNMHMLHDMVADILADDSITDKRAAIFEARDMMLASRLGSGPAERSPHDGHDHHEHHH
jgi:hypothetical protein